MEMVRCVGAEPSQKHLPRRARCEALAILLRALGEGEREVQQAFGGAEASLRARVQSWSEVLAREHALALRHALHAHCAGIAWAALEDELLASIVIEQALQPRAEASSGFVVAMQSMAFCCQDRHDAARVHRVLITDFVVIRAVGRAHAGKETIGHTHGAS